MMAVLHFSLLASILERRFSKKLIHLTLRNGLEMSLTFISIKNDLPPEVQNTFYLKF